MTTDLRFIAWFVAFWIVQLAWRVYRHYRGDRPTSEEWARCNLLEWAAFFFIWFAVLR